MATYQTPDQGIKDYLSVADFDAYEVLVGSSADHVLAAIALTEGTVLGRKTGPGEVIGALSAADLLGLAFPSADPHYAYMGPVSAPAAAPTWRAMVAKDIPDISADYISATTAITANEVLAGPITGAAAAPTFRMLDTKDVPDLSATYSVLAHTHSYLPLAGGTLIGDLYAPTIYGSATASGTLLLKGTSNATLGNVQIGAYSSFNDATGFVGIGTLTPAQKLDVQSGAIRFSYVPTISAAGCTFAAGAAGINTAGVHRIKVTAINALGETEAGTMSGTYTVATNEQINVSDILVSPDPTVTGRNIWATKAGGSTYYRVAASPCMDNIATAYTINVADASLTVNATYVYNRTSGVIYFGSRPLIYTDGQATGLYIGGDGTDYYNSLVTTIGAGSGGLIYFRNYTGTVILGIINTYGIGSLACTPVSGENFAMLGTSAAKVTQQRATVAAGFSLTVNAAGAKSGGTDLAAGELILSSGISTGAGVGAASLWAAPAGAAGVGDNAPVRVLTATALSGGAAGTFGVGIGTATPVYKLDVVGDANISEGSYYRYGAGILAYAQTALHNYYFGNAGNLTTTGAYNVAIGEGAGASLGAGANYNVMIGAFAGNSNSSGDGSVFIGDNAGCFSTTGINSVYIGTEAGYGHAGAVYAGADYNVCVGYRAGYTLDDNADYNVCVGSSAGFALTTGIQNTFLGAGAGSSFTTASNEVAVGINALGYTTGVGNVGVGGSVGLYCTTGAYNTFLGYEAGFGHAATAYTAADFNVCVGYRAGYTLDDNADYNTLIGSSSGLNLTTADGCVLIGNLAGSALTTESGKLYIANTNTGIGSALVVGDFTTGYLGSGYDAAFAPSAFFDIEKSGTAKSTVDFVEITNLVNAADMDATGTGILFNQWYYDAETPAVLPSARIAAVCENDWTSAQSNSSLDFYTRMRPNIELKMRLNSRGTIMLGGTAMDDNLYNAVHLFYNGTSSNTPTANSIAIFGIDSTDSTTALGILTEQVIQDGAITADKKAKIKWNGAWYYLGLEAIGA